LVGEKKRRGQVIPWLLRSRAWLEKKKKERKRTWYPLTFSGQRKLTWQKKRQAKESAKNLTAKEKGERLDQCHKRGAIKEGGFSLSRGIPEKAARGEEMSLLSSRGEGGKREGRPHL